jgi:glycosyltransferase involved in cell wall biosynthesis
MTRDRFGIITAGTGSYHCGTCMRDNALGRGLRERGHHVELVPLYLPMQLDEEEAGSCPIFMGGISAFLRHSSGFYRRLPTWVDKMVDRPILLRFAAAHSHMTDPETLGSLTVDNLRGPAGHQAAEIDRLVAYLHQNGPYRAVFVSNALLGGLVPRLRAGLGCPVIVSLQGEDSFVDDLPDRHRRATWDLMRERLQEADACVGISEYYGEVIRKRCNLDNVVVVSNGIDFEGYAVGEPSPQPPVIGFFAHCTPIKGLHVVVDAFCRLAARLPSVRLHIGGSCAGADKRYVAEQRRFLEQTGLSARVDWTLNCDRAEKIRFLQNVHILSVVPGYGEAFGLYAVEGLAAGAVPVLPRRGALPEILETCNAGLLVDMETDAALALAAAWEPLCRDAATLQRERQRVVQAQPALYANYGLDSMCQGMLDLIAEVEG